MAAARWCALPRHRRPWEQIKPEVVEVYKEIERILGRHKLEQLYALLEELEAGLLEGQS